MDPLTLAAILAVAEHVAAGDLTPEEGEAAAREVLAERMGAEGGAQPGG